MLYTIMVDCWIIRLRLFHPELKVNKILIILYSFISVIYKIINPTYKILNQKNRLHFLLFYLMFGYNPGVTVIKKCRKYPENMKFWSYKPNKGKRHVLVAGRISKEWDLAFHLTKMRAMAAKIV